MTDSHKEARESFAAGDFEASRQASLTGLEFNAEDLELLRLAGKSGVEVASDDAVAMLQKAVALNPEDAGAWHDLGEALAAEGRLNEAVDAFGKAVDRRPDDAVVLVDYGHSAYAAGRVPEAIVALEKVVELQPDDTETAHSLIGIYRTAGRHEDAAAAASRLQHSDPDDVLALIEFADLSLALDRLDDAAGAYERMREDDDEPEHEAYPLHGLIQVAMRRGEWAEAHELAEEALRLDGTGRTESLLGFFAAQVAAPRPDHPGRAEVDQALAASQAEHRRLHSNEFASL